MKSKQPALTRSALFSFVLALSACDADKQDAPSDPAPSGGKGDELEDATPNEGEDSDGEEAIPCADISIADPAGLLQCHQSADCHVAAVGAAEVLCTSGRTKEPCESIVPVNPGSSADPTCDARIDCEMTEIEVVEGFVDFVCRSRNPRCQTIDATDPDQAKVCEQVPQCAVVAIEDDSDLRVCLPV